jgi:hypothetical protein
LFPSHFRFTFFEGLGTFSKESSQEKPLVKLTIYPRGQFNKQRAVIGLLFSIKGGAVTAYLTALFAFMDNNEVLFRIGLCTDRAHKATAGICSIARVYIDVKRPQAKGAMIS